MPLKMVAQIFITWKKDSAYKITLIPQTFNTVHAIVNVLINLRTPF